MAAGAVLMLLLLTGHATPTETLSAFVFSAAVFAYTRNRLLGILILAVLIFWNVSIRNDVRKIAPPLSRVTQTVNEGRKDSIRNPLRNLFVNKPSVWVAEASGAYVTAWGKSFPFVGHDLPGLLVSTVTIGGFIALSVRDPDLWRIMAVAFALLPLVAGAPYILTAVMTGCGLLYITASGGKNHRKKRPSQPGIL